MEHIFLAGSRRQDIVKLHIGTDARSLNLKSVVVLQFHKLLVILFVEDGSDPDDDLKLIVADVAGTALAWAATFHLFRYYIYSKHFEHDIGIFKIIT